MSDVWISAIKLIGWQSWRFLVKRGCQTAVTHYPAEVFWGINVIILPNRALKAMRDDIASS